MATTSIDRGAAPAADLFAPDAWQEEDFQTGIVHRPWTLGKVRGGRQIALRQSGAILAEALGSLTAPREIMPRPCGRDGRLLAPALSEGKCVPVRAACQKPQKTPCHRYPTTPTSSSG